MANITLKNSLHLLWHYVQIFVLRLSLFLQVCSIHQAHFYQNYCLRTNMQYIKMFYLSFIYFFVVHKKTIQVIILSKTNIGKTNRSLLLQQQLNALPTWMNFGSKTSITLDTWFQNEGISLWEYHWIFPLFMPRLI